MSAGNEEVGSFGPAPVAHRARRVAGEQHRLGGAGKFTLAVEQSPAAFAISSVGGSMRLSP